MKKYFLGTITGVILTLIIGASASYLYNAKDIEFNASSSEFEATNVEDAINEIVLSGDATENDIMFGKTALVSGKLITGNFKFGSLINSYNAWIKGSGTYTNGSETLTKGKYIILFSSSTVEYSAISQVTNCDNLNKFASVGFFNDAGTNGLADYTTGRGSVVIEGYICELDTDKTITMASYMKNNYKGRSTFALYYLK